MAMYPGVYWQRLVRQRVSRRKLMRGAAVSGVGLAAAIALGCGEEREAAQAPVGTATAPASQATATATAAAEQPVYGGQMIRAAATVDNERFDPHTSLFAAIHIWNTIGNRAIELNPHTFKPEPALVQSWEIIGDGTEIVLKVRPDAKWHNKPPSNGRDVTAEDVSYSLMRILGTFDQQNIALYQRRSTLVNMNRAEAIDPSTVRIVFDKPSSPFLAGIADPRNTIVPKDFAEEVGFDDAEKFVGSGPFFVEEYKNGERATFKRNPDFWRKDSFGNRLPYFDGVRWAWLPDVATLRSAFITGQHDWADGGDKAGRDLLSQSAKDAQLFVWQFGNWNHLRLNLAKPPFDDLRVRKAIHLALDYKTMNDAFYGDGFWECTGPLTSVFPEAIPSDEIAQMPGWNPATKQQDIARAKQLMSEAGYPDGAFAFPLMPLIPTQTSVFFNNAVRTQDHLKKIWPNMDVQLDLPSDSASGSRRQAQGDFTGLFYIIQPQYDPALELQQQYHSKGSRNYGKVNHQNLDSLLESAIVELDTEKRKALLLDIQRLIIDEVVATLTINRYHMVFFANPKIRGYKELAGPGGTGSFDISTLADRYWKAA